MTSEDLFTVATRQEKAKPSSLSSDSAQPTTKKAVTPQVIEKPPKALGSNVPEMSVADLASSLKRTLEQTFSHIRVRGELSGIKIVGSGHMYGDIKDVDANINIVCWKGVLSKLSIRPEDGMDVIVTGRVSSYAKSSRYQIIIEKMELAGEGALLKMLEERRKKLADEGLFTQERKQKLPFLPKTIGVITSPTGAVIRDIMHRLKDRFPRHVLLWPVNVQGAGSDVQISNAIDGFNKLDGSGLPRPDLLIVARGGGSLEDLMAFNEENVVRAVANSKIPVISAVGHETDTTLVDYAADVRAPTPTGAAEIAVPVRLDLLAQIRRNHDRLITASLRLTSDKKNQLDARTARLTHPKQILENKAQTIDYLNEKLSNALKDIIQVKKSALNTTSSKIVSPRFIVEQQSQKLSFTQTRLKNTGMQIIKEKSVQLKNHDRMLQSLSYQNVLSRGYAIIRDENDKILRNSTEIEDGQSINIEFDKNDAIKANARKSA